ncbi:uncharacterized protein FSUBG_7512 [Fusarium subglutinans]|uniref:Uncharacterized protein n=1 Tax=Gibberella subglutinans TaxID=42677 RepID=A0A8H5PUV9_GIBSU|nr:uncharacterized protein FSUBG_7512 [Fusarium subglutinans]KAF5602872.1 hypothetical protein FSUBG_7512 [Fusarium subglutinans]
MEPWHTMCQCPNSNVEANDWTPCTCPYPSPPDESSSTHASPNSVSYDDDEHTVSSPAASEHQGASDPDQEVSFCYGACPNHYGGCHPEMDDVSPNLLIDFEPQDTQSRDHTTPTESGQSSNTTSPSGTEDQGIRSAAKESVGLPLLDRSIVEGSLNDNMKWETIHKDRDEIWAAKTEGADEKTQG